MEKSPTVYMGAHFTDFTGRPHAVARLQAARAAPCLYVIGPPSKHDVPRVTEPMTAPSLSTLAVSSGALARAERVADSCNSYLAALQAMAHRRDLPAWRASQDKPAAHARSVPLTVTVEGERHGFGRLWFDGAGWHQRLVLGRRPLCWFDGSVWCPRRVAGRYLPMGPVELVVVAKLAPAMPDAGLADAAAAACCGLALADLRQVQRAVLCREAASAASVEIDLRRGRAADRCRTSSLGGNCGQRAFSRV
jgi:hypothetical protein